MPLFATFSANFCDEPVGSYFSCQSVVFSALDTRGLPKISIQEKSLTIPSTRAAALLHSPPLFPNVLLQFVRLVSICVGIETHGRWRNDM